MQYFRGLDSFMSRGSEVTENSIALISNTHTLPHQLPKILLDNTALWIHSNSGYDNFQASFVSLANYPIILGNPIRAHAVTEYILANLFENYGLIKHQGQWDKSRKWERALLRESNILICGEGLIGRKLKTSLSPLSNTLSTFDPFVYPDQARSLKAFLKNEPPFNIILLATSLNSSSHHLINKDVLDALADNFLLINAARGGLIDEKALLAFLKNNPMSKAVLDVFEVEPTPADYTELPNLKRTSHIAGVSAKLDEDIVAFEKQVLSSFLKDNSHFLDLYSDLNLRNRLINDAKELI